MLRNRYTVVIADRSSGVIRRITLNLRSVIGLLVAILGTPVLLGFGVSWLASTELDRLKINLASLEVENLGYRSALTTLGSEIAALEAVVTDIDKRAVLNPRALEALNQLPAELKARAIGGGAGAITSNPLYTVALTSPRTTFTILKDLLAGLNDRLQHIRYSVENRSALASATPQIWPTGPHSYLSSAFGYRIDPFTGIRSFHRAVDISTPHGQPVLATAAGRIVSARPNGNLGKLIVIDHGFGLTTRYGHLSSFTVGAGDQVSRGDLIGHVGSTGRSTGSHVHYEVWADGRPINPYRFLSPSETLSTN
ncbi:MAG TPA: M23 family metallopeptidase [Acidobacteria bacterium]|nr:M23 family metallopeptidase [Acidobacteriota bacterium]